MTIKIESDGVLSGNLRKFLQANSSDGEIRFEADRLLQLYELTQ